MSHGAPAPPEGVGPRPADDDPRRWHALAVVSAAMLLSLSALSHRSRATSPSIQIRRLPDLR